MDPLMANNQQAAPNANNQQAAPGGANQPLPVIDGNQPPAVCEDPFRTFVVNPTLSERERGLVQDELTYSPEDHTLRHGGLCLQLNKFIIVTHGRGERDKSLTKLSDATKEAAKELALDFRRVHDDDKTLSDAPIHAPQS